MQTESVADLAAAHDALEEARERVAAVGEADLKRLRTAYRALTALLEQYADSATGSGDFEAFVTFQGEVASLVEDLDDDLRHRDAFEAADEVLQQRRLSDADFERAREELAPVADAVDRLTDRAEAREAYAAARRDVIHRRRELSAAVDDLERLVRLGEADLDAPTERLRTPIERYDEAVAAAFADFRREAPARQLFTFLDATAAFPLVPFEEPPPDLREFVDTHPAGTEPVSTLLEYADYSTSKLEHYVEDAGALKRAVATRQTYLRTLDAEPLSVGWPPPSAAELRYLTDELLRVVGRFADDDVLTALREVRALPRTTDYEHLRESALAAAELGPDERERLREGSVAEDLQAARDALARCETALEEYPSL
jgi:hypothetical protein